MLNKSCKHCGSSNTYAVSSRARKAIDVNGKIALDSEGNEIIIMCRHCRRCGKYYYVDEKEQYKRHLSPAQEKLIDEVLKLRANKSETSSESEQKTEIEKK